MKSYAVCAFLLFSMLALLIPLNIVKVDAGLESGLTLDSGSYPASMVYDNNTNSVWIALHYGYPPWNSSIANIDVASKSVIGIYQLPYSLDSGTWGPFAEYITMDSNGNVWVAPSDYLHWIIPEVYVFMFNVSSQNWTTVLVDNTSLFGIGDIAYTNGYIWVLGYTNIYRVNFNNNNSVLKIPSPSGITLLDGSLCEDGTNLWISTSNSGSLLMLNTTDNSVKTVLNGLNNPRGMCVDNTFLYIAEQGQNVGGSGNFSGNTITVMNKIDYGVTTITCENCTGVQNVAIDENGSLWWTDTSPNGEVMTHVGVFNVTYTLYEYAYYVIYVPNPGVWVSYTGSAGIKFYNFSGFIQGDVNKDGRVSMTDVVDVLGAFGAVNGTSRYNPTYDFDNNSRIDMSDIMVVLRHFGQVST